MARATKQATAGSVKRAPRPRKKRAAGAGRPRSRNRHSGHLEAPQQAAPIAGTPEPLNMGAGSSIPSQHSQIGSLETESGETENLLDADLEAMLSGGPQVVSDPDAPEPEMAEDAQAGELSASLGENIIDHETAAGILVGFGGLLAEWRDCDAYRDGGETAAKSAASGLVRVVNNAWAQMAPGLMQSFESKCPGIVALILALVLAFAPAVFADLKQKRAKRNGVQRGVSSPVNPQHPTAAAPVSGAVPRSGGGIVSMWPGAPEGVMA